MHILVLGPIDSEPDFQEVADLFNEHTRYVLTGVYNLGLPGVSFSAWQWAFQKKLPVQTIRPGWRVQGIKAVPNTISRILRQEPVGGVFWVGEGEDPYEQEACLEGLKTRLWRFTKINDKWAIEGPVS